MHRCHGSSVCHTSVSCSQHRSRKSLQACLLPFASTAVHDWLRMAMHLQICMAVKFCSNSNCFIQSYACDHSNDLHSVMYACSFVLPKVHVVYTLLVSLICHISPFQHCTCIQDLLIREHPFTFFGSTCIIS